MQNTAQEATAERQSVRWGSALWQLAAAAAGALLGGGRIFGQVTPFGLALVLGVAPGYLMAASAGAAAGGFLFLPVMDGVRMAGAIAAAFAGRLLLRKKFWPAALAGGATLLLVQLLLSLYAVSSLADLAATVGTALLSVAIGFGLARLPAGKPSSLCLWLCILAASGQRLSVGFFHPGLALLALSVLVVAWRGDLQQTAVVGLSMAAAIGMADSTLCCPAVEIAAAALLSHILSDRVRGLCGLLFGVGCCAAAAVSGSTAAGAGVLTSLSISLCLFYLLPFYRLDLQAVLPALEQQQTMNGAAARLNGIADALADVAETVTRVAEKQAPKGENFNWVIDYVAEDACRDCDKRETCWVVNYNSTIDGFYRLKPELERQVRPAVEQLPGQFSMCRKPQKLCAAAARGYALYRSRRESRVQTMTMRVALTEQYGALAEALAQLADQLCQSGTPEPSKAVRVQKLFSSLGLETLDCTVNRDWSDRITVNVSLPRMSLSREELEELTQETGVLCRRELALPRVTHCHTVTTLQFCEQPVFLPEFGVACHSAGDVSGDATEQFCDGLGRAQMLLCDGMGTGKPAAVDGVMAAKLTAKLLWAGLDGQATARLVNVALALKGDEESGATMDLLTLDLYTGKASLFKAGAAPSFLVRGDRVLPVDGTTLPVGVLEKVVGQTDSLTMQAGDYLVLLSDGALADGQGWICHQLGLCAARGDSARQMAKAVADGARQRTSGTVHPDDITVEVCHLMTA